MLGIKCSDKIIKQNVNLENNKYNFLFSGIEKMSDDLGCVLLSINNNN